MESLVAASESAVIKGFQDKLSNGKFTCGGTIPASKVRVNYLQGSGQWGGFEFPGINDVDFRQLIQSSAVATFGKGKETVTDKNYRDSYTLEPEKFITSFQLCDSSILGEIRLLLAPDVPSIGAELYKMNIYTAPRGCFKSHVDTPRKVNMFGSLVVCLPSRFTGGALLVRHSGEEVNYDWSSPHDNPEGICWAAFYSDVEHEILPVTEGYRVTLTYNLYHCQDQIRPALHVNTPFCNYLKTALGHPHFLRNGGTLGFICQHAYVFEEFDKKEKLTLLLKGSDRMILLAAESLGLRVKIQSIVNAEGYDEMENDSWELKKTLN